MLEGNRKFLITLIYLIICSVLVATKLIPGNDFISYTSYVIMIYMGGNIGEWVAKRK